MPYYISPPPQNPLSRILAGIFAVLMLIGAFTIGLVALLVIAGVGLFIGILIWLRVAWIKYRLKKSGIDLDAHMSRSARGAESETGDVIEAEYTVISKDEE